MNYAIVALIFVIVMMLYMAYFYLTNISLTTGVLKLNESNAQANITEFSWQKLDNPAAKTYHYEGWVFVQTLPSADTCIFVKDTNGGVALNLKETTLTIVEGATYTNGTGTPTAAQTKVTVTTKFPIQKWVYFVVNIINGTIVEVYLNGKLVKTQQLPTALSNLTRGTLKLGGTSSMDGYLTKFIREPKSLTADEVWKKYLAGNGLATFTNWLAGYNASFSVSTSTEEIKKISMF